MLALILVHAQRHTFCKATSREADRPQLSMLTTLPANLSKPCLWVCVCVGWQE